MSPPRLSRYLMAVRGRDGEHSKNSQTDEEKQRDRQRNEREAKKEEQDAINYKRDKEQREARLLDFEIRRQQKRDEQQQQRQQQQQLQQHREQQHQQQQQHKEQQYKDQQPHHREQLQQQASEKSPPTSSTSQQQHQQHQQHQHQRQQQQQQQQQQQSTGSGSSNTPVTPKLQTPPPDRSLPPAFRSRSIEREIHYERKRFSQPDPGEIKELGSTTSSSSTQQTFPASALGPGAGRAAAAAALPGPTAAEQSATLAGPPATAAAATAAIIPILPLGVATLRDDSTESDQSVTCAHHQLDAYHRIMCRAPIASLDCMEEFSGTGGHLDFGRSISLGSNPALPLRHGSTPTPGLRYKNLGKSGLRISNVGLGTWPVFSPGVSDDQAEAILKLAIESGINLFDISEAHSETEIGKILQRAGWKRTAYVITTKVYWSTKSEERGLSRKHIIECVRASLQRLQLQYIDIVIIHKADPMCPMEEVVRAMSYVIQQGWAMYWGTARWSQVEIMEAYTNCRQFNCITPIVEQSEYHMFCREKCELYLPEMYNKIGVGLMAWGPLSMALSDTQNGDKLFLPKGSFKTKSFSWTEDEINRNAALSPQGSWGKDRIEEGRRHCDRLRDLAALAEKLGCSPTQLSIAWSLKHEPVQCLLLGATSAEQLHQSLQSLQLLPRLSSSVMLELERILENKPVRPPMISTLALR
ncbi:hypothetical protein KR009_007576 [Drosophila setifemur]|nr:hypothetical protein KR009_007576 [Drosophila setifemur]